MPDQDIPFVDEAIARQPADIREDLAEKGRSDLYFFAKGILGFKDMTERCHGQLCAFADLHPAQFKMMLMPRDHFKSSVITIAGSLQRVVKNPELTQLIANESATNAERFLRAIRQHAEGNKIFRALYSEVIPKDTRKVRWNDSELDFVRQGHYPEPTIDTIGMTGAATSRHYRHITIDDPISEEAVKSEKVMNDTITRLSGFTALLTKPEYDTTWIVGTRWAFWDVYQWYIDNYGDKLGKFFRSVIDPYTGELIFPELISADTLALKRRILGEYRFSCLYMNNPRNNDVQDLNVEDLRWYSWAADGKHIELFTESRGELSNIRQVRIDQLQLFVTVDLAPAETATSDRNAVILCGITPWNEVIILDVFAQRCTPLEVIDHLVDLHKRFGHFKLGIEDVAYQKAFKYFLKDYATKLGIYFNVVPLKAVGKKVVRIRGLQPVLATGKIYADPKQHLLRSEMADFPLGKHDDVIDALSMQLQMWPHRLSPEHWEQLAAVERKLMSKEKEARLRKEYDLDPDEEIDPEFHISGHTTHHLIERTKISRPRFKLIGRHRA